jgi:hypothetical protein
LYIFDAVIWYSGPPASHNPSAGIPTLSLKHQPDLPQNCVRKNKPDILIRKHEGEKGGRHHECGIGEEAGRKRKEEEKQARKKKGEHKYG